VQENGQGCWAQVTITDSPVDERSGAADKVDVGHVYEEELKGLLDIRTYRCKERKALLSRSVLADTKLDVAPLRVGEGHVEVHASRGDFKTRRIDDRFSKVTDAGANDEGAAIDVHARLP
jgi:hypothetical protein